MKNTMLSVASVATLAGVLFAGYLLVTSLPDLRRYIRISTM